MITVACPQCGLSIQAPETVIGKKARCRRCQTVFVAAVGGGPPVASPGSAASAPIPDPLAELDTAISAPPAGATSGNNLDELFGHTAPVDPSRSPPRRKSSSGGNLGILAVGVLLAAVAVAVWLFRPKGPEGQAQSVMEMPPQTIPENKLYRVKIGAGAAAEDAYLEMLDGPGGAKIAESGDFSWSPTEAQGPNDYVISLVTKSRRTSAITSRVNLRLTVEEVSEPPVFDKVEVITAVVGQPVSARVHARDTDLPAVPVVYSLKGEATARTPDFNPRTAEVTWTPEIQDAGKTISVIVVATEEGGKNLSSEQAIRFQVRPADTPIEQFLARFRATKAKIEPFPGFAEFDLKGETHPFKINGEELYVFLYEDAAAAEKEMEAMRGDKARLAAAAGRVGTSIIFYQQGSGIAAYMGASSPFASLLESTLGKPVAEAKYSAAPITVKGLDEWDKQILTMFDERDRRSKSPRLFSPFEYTALRKIRAQQFEKENAEEIEKAFGDDTDAMRKWLDERSDFKESLYLAFDPHHDDVVAGLRIVKELKEKFPKQIDKYLSLVIATAVVWDKPGGGVPSYEGHQRRTHSILPSGLLGAIENFQYLIEAEPVMQGRIQFVPWEFLVHVCNHKTPLVERQWAVANYVPKRVLFGKCYSDVPYDNVMLQTESKVCKLGGKEYTLPNILNFGGVCAMQADFAARVGKSIGVPAEYVGGAAASGDLHAWVMWIELTAATPTNVAFTLQSHGRYRGDHYFVGTLRSPQTGEQITDRDLERRLNAVGTSAFNKRQADLAMEAYQMVKNERKLDLDAQLEFLTHVTRLSPWNEAAWREAARLARGPTLDKRGRTELLAVLNQLFSTFAPFPDFTLEIFPTLVEFEPEDKTRIQHYYKLLDMYAAANRPDLSFAALHYLSDLLVQNERQVEAIQALAAAIKKYANQGNYVPKMLDHLEKLCETPEHKAALIGFYGEFLPLVPTKRGDESSKYCMRMYERGIAKFQEAGQTQLAQVYQAKLAELRAK